MAVQNNTNKSKLHTHTQIKNRHYCLLLVNDMKFGLSSYRKNMEWQWLRIQAWNWECNKKTEKTAQQGIGIHDKILSWLIKVWTPSNLGSFLTRCGSSSFSKTTMLHILLPPLLSLPPSPPQFCFCGLAVWASSSSVLIILLLSYCV